MRSIMKKAACFALAGALVLTGTGFNTTSADAAAKPKKIVMKKKSITVSVGGKYTLKVKKVSPSKASKAVTYKSKNKKIAKVTKKGVVKGVKEGKTKITVTAKKNKKVKTTVKVKVTPAVDVKTSAAPSIAPSVAPSAVPNKSATPTQAVKPTDQPQQTEAAATGTPKPKTTRSPRPKATPSPEPTAPPMGAPAAPYKLTLSDDTVVDQTGGSHVINADGSATISVTQQYGGVGFVAPADLKDNNFDTGTVTYKDATNVGTGYGCGLWRSGDDKDTEDVVNWSGVFADAAEGEFTATIAGKSDTNSYYVNKILFFNNDAEVLSAETPASVTITSVVFSNSKYDGPMPTEAPTVEPTEAPVAAPYKLTLSDDTVSDQGGSGSHVINADGSATITVTQQYGGARFTVPADLDLKDNNFDTVTVTYKDATNVGGGFGCSLWRLEGDEDKEDVRNWGGVFADAAEGEFKASIDGKSYVKAIQFFNNDKDSLDKAPASVTITSVVFSNSKYEAPMPTEAPTVEPTEAPVSSDVVVDLSDAASYSFDGADMAATYDAATGLSVDVANFQGIIIKNTAEDVADYKYATIKYTTEGKINGYYFDGQMGNDGLGQTPDGQVEGTSLEATEETATVRYEADNGMYGIKLVRVDFGTNAGTKMVIKSVVFSKGEAEVEPTETPTVEPTEAPVEPSEAPEAGFKTVDLSKAILVGSEGNVTVAEDGSVSYAKSGDTGFDGFMFEIGEALSAGDKLEVKIDAEGTGSSPRIYLLDGTADFKTSVDQCTNLVKDTVYTLEVAPDKAATHIFVKVGSYGQKFDSLTVRSISVKKITKE